MAAPARPVSWQDWAVPVALLFWAQGETWVPGAAAGTMVGPRWVFAAQSVGCCAALLWRRSRPLASALVVSVLLLAPSPWGWNAQFGSQVLTLVVAVFACGRYGPRPGAYLALPLGPLMVVAQALVDSEQDLAASWGWSLNTLWIFALGAGFRHERLLREQVAQSAEDRSRATAAEKRLHVAREVHDVLSHSLSVVVVQAEVADTFLESDPARTRRAIGEIAATGRSALRDTRRIVGLLREPDGRAPAVPAPTLADVPALVGRMREAGLPVSLDLAPGIPPLAVEVTETAYRVVQESLTNVLRHAGKVATSVRLAPDPAGVVIEVHDHGTPPRAPAQDTGHGLVGMRERVSECGGELTAGPSPKGGFRVQAVLPAQDQQ